MEAAPATRKSSSPAMAVTIKLKKSGLQSVPLRGRPVPPAPNMLGPGLHRSAGGITYFGKCHCPVRCGAAKTGPKCRSAPIFATTSVFRLTIVVDDGVGSQRETAMEREGGSARTRCGFRYSPMRSAAPRAVDCSCGRVAKMLFANRIAAAAMAACVRFTLQRALLAAFRDTAAVAAGSGAYINVSS